jgi:hypothetical protein
VRLYRLFDALAVGTVYSVDPDLVALVDEQGHHEGCSGLKGALFESVAGSGIALDSGFGVGNLKLYIGRELACEAALLLACEEDHLYALALFHKVGIVDHIEAQVNLLKSFGMHEVETVLIFVEILIGAVLHGDQFNLLACAPGFLQDAAVLQVAEFGFDESGTLARLNVLEPYDRTRLAVEIYAKTILKISCCCHIDILMINS